MTDKTTISIHQFNFSKDVLNPIATLSFKDSTDFGFMFRTNNMEITCRFNKHDYYSFIHTLISSVIDETDEQDNTLYEVDDLTDYLISKFSEK